MASLKDQLLKAGLVSKKQARLADQQAREQRKQGQGSREAQALLAAREAEAQRAERDRLVAEKLAAREARERAREQEEIRHRIDQILQSHRAHYRHGKQPFWHPSPDRRFLARLDLPESLAHELHGGKLAVSWRGPADAFEPDIVLIPREVAERIQRLDPQRILFHNPERPTDPEDALWSSGPSSSPPSSSSASRPQ